jgi:hypothetical protein
MLQCFELLERRTVPIDVVPSQHEEACRAKASSASSECRFNVFPVIEAPPKDSNAYDRVESFGIEVLLDLCQRVNDMKLRAIASLPRVDVNRPELTCGKSVRVVSGRQRTPDEQETPHVGAVADRRKDNLLQDAAPACGVTEGSALRQIDLRPPRRLESAQERFQHLHVGVPNRYLRSSRIRATIHGRWVPDIGFGLALSPAQPISMMIERSPALCCGERKLPRFSRVRAVIWFIADTAAAALRGRRARRAA